MKQFILMNWFLQTLKLKEVFRTMMVHNLIMMGKPLTTINNETTRIQKRRIQS